MPSVRPFLTRLALSSASRDLLYIYLYCNVHKECQYFTLYLPILEMLLRPTEELDHLIVFNLS